MLNKIKNSIIDMVATTAMAILIYLDDIIDTIVTTALSVVTCLIIVNYLFMPVIVSGTSMYPTLQNNQIGFANMIGKTLSGVERFDIVVVYIAEKDENIVKRVIGLPGETISFVNDTLYVDGVPMDQDFLNSEYVQQQTEQSFAGYFTNNFTVTLGEDEYFCMGDNRLVSQDSRYYGPFSLKEIVAKDIFTIYPFSMFGKAN